MTSAKSVFTGPRRKRTVDVGKVMPENNSDITPSRTISQYTDPILNTSPLKSQDNSSNSSYENIPECPKPPNVRHSHIQIQECPAYRVTEHNSSNYDDVCSTAVVMKSNPSYRHVFYDNNDICSKK